MSSESCPFSPRQAQGVSLLASGLTPQEIGTQLGIRSGANILAEAKVKAHVTTNRALVYVSLSRGWIPVPDPGSTGDVSRGELEELVWAGLRIDVRDTQLPGVLAAVARTTPHQVRDILDDLKTRLQLTYCGLITQGYALGILSGREGTSRPRMPEPVAAPRKTARPQSGPARTGPWKLTGRQHEVLALLPASRTLEDAAAQMGLRVDSYRNHLKTISEIAGVCCLRALTHRALQDEALHPPQITAPDQPDLAPAVMTVWRKLVLNVPDAELADEIWAGTGLSDSAVRSALDQLRAQGESDSQLVLRGWAAGVITPQDDSNRPARARASRRSAPPARRVPPLASPARPRPPGPHLDRLNLLPASRIPDLKTRRTAGSTKPPLGPVVHIGQDIDIVRVLPDVCRRLLAGIPRREWGPVIGRVDAANALLLTRSGVLRSGWRARHGRLWQRGRTITLPPQDRPEAGGAYWAVPSHTALWDPDRLEQLLTDLPAPTVPGFRETVGGGGR
ncbi:hypothetical protein ACFY2N_34355 [Streptomyces rubiginosohelvolus]|uniref:hypothetical protein n=1 Tax=Streptomyces rubiginosohelvolus TaxID=67362 RepID=UPI0036A793BD